MSEMLLHELHPALVHAPLVLLPTATVADCIALARRDRAWEKVGRTLWVAGAAGALLTGWAGFVASQEVRLEEPRARDMVFLHGVGNTLITLGAVGVTLWRLGRQPSPGQCAVAIAACGAAMYTATLGGKAVYERGVGIIPMPREAATGVRRAPLLLSAQAPMAMVRDGAAGVGWLLSRARALLRGSRPLAPGAKGFGGRRAEEWVSEPRMEPAPTAPSQLRP
jgi:uncharacterized membrane protein